MALSTDPTYNGSDGGLIDLPTARQWAQNYRTTHPKELQSHYFGRNLVDQILAQPGCTGIRVYYATNDEQERQLLVVGVNDLGASQLPTSPVVVPGEFAILDFSFPCPPKCPTGSEL